MRYHLNYPRFAAPPKKLNSPQGKKRVSKSKNREPKYLRSKLKKCQQLKSITPFLHICHSLKFSHQTGHGSRLRKKDLNSNVNDDWYQLLAGPQKDILSKFEATKTILAVGAFQLEVLESVKTLIYMIVILYCQEQGSFYHNIRVPAVSALIVSHEDIQLVPFHNNYVQRFNVGNIKMWMFTGWTLNYWAAPSVKSISTFTTFPHVLYLWMMTIVNCPVHHMLSFFVWSFRSLLCWTICILSEKPLYMCTH